MKPCPHKSQKSRLHRINADKVRHCRSWRLRHGTFLSTPTHEDKAVYMKHGKPIEPRIQRPVSHRFRSGLPYLWNSFVTVITEVTSFAHPAPRIMLPHADVSSALRDDWVRIGLDMGVVIKRKQDELVNEET